MGSENTDIDMPVIKFSNILMVPLSEDMDDESIDRLQDNVLRKVERHKPHGVIFDVSTVSIIDSFFVRVLSETVQMISLMGTPTVMAGMQPNVALAATQLGLKIEGAMNTMNVDQAVEILLEHNQDHS